MRYIVIALLSFILGMVFQKFILRTNPDTSEISYVLQNSIEQVSKLVVTEAQYSQMFTETSSDKYLYDLIHFDKKAIIVGTAFVNVSYNLKLLEYDLDASNKIIRLTKIPGPQLDYKYEFQWYDIEQSRMNQFSQAELNQIQDKAKAQVKSKINTQILESQAHDRLLEELGRMWVGFVSMGWKIDDVSQSTTNFQT